VRFLRDPPRVSRLIADLHSNVWPNH